MLMAEKSVVVFKEWKNIRWWYVKVKVWVLKSAALYFIVVGEWFGVLSCLLVNNTQFGGTNMF